MHVRQRPHSQQGAQGRAGWSIVCPTTVFATDSGILVQRSINAWRDLFSMMG